MIGRTTYIDYKEEESLIVRLCVRMEDGKRRNIDVYGVRPYGFFPAGKSELPEVVTERETGYEGYDGVALDKIYTRFPRETKEVEKRYDQSYEADIPFYRRCSVDGLSGHIDIPDDSERTHDNLTGDEIHIDDIDLDPDVDEPITPRTVMSDIEVIPDHSVSFEQMTENANQPIVNITIYDPYDNQYVAIVLDGERDVDGMGVKGYVQDHWEGTDYEDYGEDFSYKLKRCADEASLLNTFIGWIEDNRPDLISGWNWVDFDHEYLLRRMEKFSRVNQHRLSDIGTVGRPDYNIERAIDGLPAFDMMQAFAEKMTFHDWRSESLDYISNEELGIGKVDDISIKKSLKNNPTRLLAYNIIDVQLLVALDDVNGIHDFFYELSDLCGIPIYDSFSEMRLIDGYIMSRRGDDEVLPSAEEEELDSPPGGLVLSASDGVLNNVGVFDLKSLYPSVIITANISPETRVPMKEADVTIPAMVEKEDHVQGRITKENIDWSEGDGAMSYRLDKEGLVPRYVKKLFKNRGEAKSLRDEHNQDSLRYQMWNRRQRAIKIVMNSFYGVMSSPYWRLSRNGLGDSVTAGGRYTLWMGSEVAREMGYDVKYGDTDSVMLELSDKEEIETDELLSRGEELEDQINEEMKTVADNFGIPEEHPHLDGGLHGTERHTLSYEFEKLYRRFFQAGSKKRYAGLMTWKEGKRIDPPEIQTVGFESNRSDYSAKVAEVQPKVIRMVLDGEPFSEVSNYISSISEGLREREVDIHDFASPGTINKPLRDYPNRPTKRACLYANEWLDANWGEGDEPWIIPIRETPPGYPKTDVIAVDWNQDLPEGFEIDIPHLLEKNLEQPLEPIINEVNWLFEELITGRKTKELDLGESGTESNPFENKETEEANTSEDSTDDEIGQKRLI